jgi:hypothetical protein
MFGSLRSLADGRSRVQKLREWFKGILGEDLSEARGLKLLSEWLSPEQQAQFEAQKFFDVVGCDSGKRYRIRYGSAMNIHELDDRGRPLVCWCLVLDAYYIVPSDVMLAQKIALETNERAALTVANRFAPRETPPPPPC